MNTKNYPLPVMAAFAALTLFITPQAESAMLASDNGSNYAAWTTGSNGGFGFGDWGFFDFGSPPNYNLESGSFLGGGADIGGNGFTLWSGDGGAVRGLLGGALSNGQTFSADLAVNYRSGFKGLSLRNEDSDLDIIQLLIAGDDYQFNDGSGAQNISGLFGATGDWGYNSNTVITLSVTRNGSDLDVLITRSGGTTGSYATTVLGVGDLNFDQISFFSFGAGGATENAIILNNLSVVPESATSVLLAGGVIAVVFLRRRRIQC